MSTTLPTDGDPVPYLQKDVRERVVVTKASEERVRIALTYLQENNITQISDFLPTAVWTPPLSFARG